MAGSALGSSPVESGKSVTVHEERAFCGSETVPVTGIVTGRIKTSHLWAE